MYYKSNKLGQLYLVSTAPREPLMDEIAAAKARLLEDDRPKDSVSMLWSVVAIFEHVSSTTNPITLAQQCAS